MIGSTILIPPVALLSLEISAMTVQAPKDVLAKRLRAIIPESIQGECNGDQGGKEE